MRIPRISGLVVLGLAGVLAAALAESFGPAAGETSHPSGPAVSPSGRLEIIAAVVGADLSVRPVPKHRFLIMPDPAPADAPAAGEVVTGFDGTASLELPPGRYRLASAQPLAWERTELRWDVPFEIASGAVTHLEVSSDNAAKSAAAARVTGEARVFHQARQAVFLVETDTGHGSGFLVDARGLVMTNYHVLGKARYVAVKLDSRRKYPGQILALDPDHDIGVVRVNPEVLGGVRPLPLAAAGPDVLVEGERVVAIGSPLTQESVMTTGVVSKIQSDAIISDVNINPGNSGGPLLNLDGAVVGINTFGLTSGQGPGISGIIRIHQADKALAEARSKVGGDPVPSAEPLPVASEIPYPAAALRDLLTSEPEFDAYKLEAGKIDVELLTPPLIHSLSKQREMKAAEQQKKRRKGSAEGTHDPKDDFYEWRRHGGDYDAVVTIRAFPEIKMTGGSKAGLFFGMLVGVVGPVRYRFKTDFREMKLLRGDVEVRPIHPGRQCEVVSVAGGMSRIEDVGCYGLYHYPPEAFAPGPPMTLKIYSEDRPSLPEVVPLDPVLVGRVYSDFAPYFTAVKESAQREGTSGQEAGPEAPGPTPPPAGNEMSPPAAPSPAPGSGRLRGPARPTTDRSR